MADQDDRFMNAASLEEIIEHGFAEVLTTCSLLMSTVERSLISCGRLRVSCRRRMTASTMSSLTFFKSTGLTAGSDGASTSSMDLFSVERGEDGGPRFVLVTTGFVCAAEEGAGVLTSASRDRFILLLDGSEASWSGAGLVAAILDVEGVFEDDSDLFLECDCGMCIPSDGSDSDTRRVL